MHGKEKKLHINELDKLVSVWIKKKLLYSIIRTQSDTRIKHSTLKEGRKGSGLVEKVSLPITIQISIVF